nr:hypothetical protein CFP56_11310 [Quercus suber]
MELLHAWERCRGTLWLVRGFCVWPGMSIGGQKDSRCVHRARGIAVVVYAVDCSPQLFFIDAWQLPCHRKVFRIMTGTRLAQRIVADGSCNSLLELLFLIRRRVPYVTEAMLRGSDALCRSGTKILGFRHGLVGSSRLTPDPYHIRKASSVASLGHPQHISSGSAGRHVHRYVDVPGPEAVEGFPGRANVLAVHSHVDYPRNLNARQQLMTNLACSVYGKQSVRALRFVYSSRVCWNAQCDAQFYKIILVLTISKATHSRYMLREEHGPLHEHSLLLSSHNSSNRVLASRYSLALCLWVPLIVDADIDLRVLNTSLHSPPVSQAIVPLSAAYEVLQY